MQAEIAIDNICSGPRFRPVDANKALEIAESMKQQGLLQPIGVRPCTCEAYEDEEHYRILFGAHRLRAAQELQWQTIPATMFPEDMTEEMAQLAELQENSVRNDLTRAQRNQYTAEAGRLLAKIAEDGEMANRQNIWFENLAKTTGTPRRTLQDRWMAFCEDKGVAASPRQGFTYEQQFLDWLEEQSKKAEAEKQRKADEARERRMQADCAKAVKYLSELIQTYSFEIVHQYVWAVIYEQWEAHAYEESDESA